MINYNKIVQNFREATKALRNPQAFFCGQLSEVDINKLGAKHYPLVYLEPGNVNIDTGTMTYSFTVYVLEQTLNEDIEKQDFFEGVVNNFEDKRDAVGDTYNFTLNILKDLISTFKQNLSDVVGNPAYPVDVLDKEMIIQIPINAQPITMQFDNVLSGWTAEIQVLVNNKNNLCTAPIYSV
tara:strand:- start:21927 stop:22469 length:543 start_codon:yes stop_codon:yes gene_type:complete